MYESPIQITQICDQIGTELVEQEEAYIFSVVKRIYVDVDRDELIKALAYDRGQYEKGFRDGYAQAMEEAIRAVGLNTWAGSRISELQPAKFNERRDNV